jgi:hypothetical protein
MGLERSMGLRAREAVEILWNSQSLPKVPSSVGPMERYQAGIRWTLRLVAIAFAESRKLLPMRSPIYAESYSLHGLWSQLEEIAARNDHELLSRFSAWPRLLSLVRLVREGSSHPDMPIRPYGGELLEPGNPCSTDGVSLALASLEVPGKGPSDSVVWQILGRLCRTGRGRRIDFAHLETDYVGQLYQAFLEGVPEVQDLGGFSLVDSRQVRKASGAFYTPISLARATVEKTLEPLCNDGHGPVPPERLLQLRVCDPAMGSGAFLVAVLRSLSQAALSSLTHHGRLCERAGKTVVRWGAGREFELPLPVADERFQEMLLAHIRRHVVECCLYGVDLDPLSVELARFSLWLETMDRHLPLTFLTHKLKVGNSLVGASLADLETYPLRAWQAHVEHSAAARNRLVECTKMLSPLATAARQPSLPFTSGAIGGRALRTDLARRITKLQRLPVQFPDLKREHYREHYLEAPARLELKRHLDTWCALWFWPESWPTEGLFPDDWYGGCMGQKPGIAKIAGDGAFFHWELEFPEVFSRRRPGFDAVVGNPPWEIIKGAERGEDEEQHRSLSNWFKGYYEPAGKFQKALARRPRKSPFTRQGSGDTNTYKLFVERGFSLCRQGGRMGFIVPAGIYADDGAGELRHLLVSKGSWEWLYGMDNRKRHFPIDGRFRFAVIVVGKGGATKSIQASFLNSTIAGLTDLDHGRWIGLESPPRTRGRAALKPFVETATVAARQALERIEVVGESLFMRGRTAWAASYHREYDAGGASKRFFSAAHWLNRGWRSDSLGLLHPPGDHQWGQLALPVYQGTMVQQYDFSAAKWGSEERRWSPNVHWLKRKVEPRFFMDLEEARFRTIPDYKVAVRRITNATNSRTVVAALVPPMPCTDKAAVLQLDDPVRQLLVVAALNSLGVDASARLRCSGTQLDRHHLAALPLPAPARFRVEEVAFLALRLCGPHPWFAPLWLDLRNRLPQLTAAGWGEHFLHEATARRLATAAIEALVAEAMGLSSHDLLGILSDCDLQAGELKERATLNRLDPRGFWRVDRVLPSAQRLPALALAAHEILTNKGPEALLATVPSGASRAVRNLSWSDCEAAAQPVLRLQEALRKRVGQQAALL